jgi:hypothetical protein
MLNMRPLTEPAISLLCRKCRQVARSGQKQLLGTQVSYSVTTQGFDERRLGNWEARVGYTADRGGCSFWA